MFSSALKSGGEETTDHPSPSSVWRIAAELLSTNSNNNNNNNSNENSLQPQLSVENSQTGVTIVEPILEDKSSEDKQELKKESCKQTFLFSAADVWHNDSTTSTTLNKQEEKTTQLPSTSSTLLLSSSPPTNLYSSSSTTTTTTTSSSPAALQVASIVNRRREMELLRREEYILQREAAIHTREEKLTQREEELRILQEQLGPHIATDAYRQQLNELKKQLTLWERTLAERQAALEKEEERILILATDINSRERELELEQERLLKDACAQVERIQQGARAVQVKELNIKQKEELSQRREGEMHVMQECLTAWERELRRRERELRGRQQNIEENINVMQDLTRRENYLKEMERRLREREETLWELAAMKVPQGRIELKTLMTILKNLHSEIVECEPNKTVNSV